MGQGSGVGFCQIAPSSNKTFIRVSTARIATTIEADLDDYTKATNTIQYMDGFGKPMQTVAYKASPTAKDLLMGSDSLDKLGRVKRTYLPVQSDSSNGSFRSNAKTLASSFYNDSAPYNEVETYEASPFSRAFKTVGAGQAFRASTTKGSIQGTFTAGAGSGTPPVRKYYVNEDVNGNVTSINGTLSFVDGDLIKRILTDEEGNSVAEFTDKEQRTIEKWVISPTGTTLKTAYIYDDIGRLRYILPPKAYNLANTFNETSSPTATYFSEGVYAVRYDERGRVSEQHKPSGGWSYRIYNELDQAVMTQNPRQRQSNLWEWVRYDGHNRTVMAGTWTSSENRATIQQYFLDFLDDNQFEERVSTSLNNLFGYTSRSFPSQIALTASDVMRVYYFDNYTWVDNSALDFSEYKTPKWTNSKGLATGSLVRKLDSGTLLKSVMYYDDKNRGIQTKIENRYGSINQTDLVLNFAGDLLEEQSIYRKPSKADIVLNTKYSYDHTGRKTGAVHYLNGKPTPLAQYKHDEIGRVIQKRLMQAGLDYIFQSSALLTGQTDIANNAIFLNSGTISAQNGTYLACIGPNMLQEIDFSYNIRGQLRGINLDALGNVLLSNGDVFGMKLDYHEDGRYYNGLISKQTWQSSSQPNNRAFTYSYDGFTRLQGASYNGVGTENYSLSGMGYDDNGNILTLQRNGLNGSGTWGQIDNLEYNYLSPSSNRLSFITENSLDNKGFKDIGGTSDYTWYDDGSIKSDNNRGITNIIYNYLGLPEQIEFGTTKRIENIYDAEGLKLSQKFVNGSTTIQTDYMGDLIYRNDSLKTIFHDEGRIFFDSLQTPHYQFFIIDNLGNTRIIIERVNANTALVQETHYGAWGEILEGIGQTGDWNFLFQGNEFVDFADYNTYDFNLRQYDPYRGQFDGIDPVDNYSVGGTVAMLNNPLTFTDKNGDCPNCVTGAIGAVIGGFANLIIKSTQGKIQTPRDALFAFGIGAAAGFVTGFTGGLAAGALGLGSTGVLSGAVTGIAGSALGDPIRGLGNAAYFQDSYGWSDYGQGVLMSGLIGGVSGGVSSLIKGTNFWNGSAKAPQIKVSSTSTDKVGEGLNSEITITKKIELEFPNGYKQDFKYWSSGKQVGKFKVFQRDDLFELTEDNIGLMLNKNAPLGLDGKSIQLHHLIQSDQAGLVEVSNTMHTQWSKTLHINPTTIQSGINRSAFRTFRENYWFSRGLELLNKNGIDATKYILKK